MDGLGIYYTSTSLLKLLIKTIIVFQGVERPNMTLIGQDRKFKDLRALLYTSFTISLFYMYMKLREGGGVKDFS